MPVWCGRSSMLSGLAESENRSKVRRCIPPRLEVVAVLRSVLHLGGWVLSADVGGGERGKAGGDPRQEHHGLAPWGAARVGRDGGVDRGEEGCIPHFGDARLLKPPSQRLEPLLAQLHLP